MDIPIVGTVIRPLDREIAAGMGMIAPNEYPKFDHAVEAYYKGWLTLPQFQNVALWSGVSFQSSVGPFQDHPTRGAAWQHILDSQRPAVPDRVIAALYAANEWDSVLTDKEQKRSGQWYTATRKTWIEQLDLPELNWLIQQWRLGVIDNDEFYRLAALHGSSGITGLTRRLNATIPFSAQVAYDLHFRGLLDLRDSDRHATASGVINARDRGAEYVLARTKFMPQASELLRLHRLGIVKRDEYDDMIRHLGYESRSLRDVLERASSTLPQGIVFELLNRGMITHDRAIQHLESSGLVDVADRVAVDSLRFVQVDPEILIQSGVRATVAINLPTLFAGDSDLPSEVRTAAERTGQDQKSIELTGVQIGDGRISPAELAWHAHWSQPNSENAVAAFRRLTPERCEQLKSVGLDVRPLLESELNAILLAGNCAPNFVDYIKALNYSPVPLRMLRLVYMSGAMPRPEAIHRIRANGILPDDAELIVKSWELQQQQQNLQPVVSYIKEQVKEGIKLSIEGYSLGYIDAGTAQTQLVAYGLPYQSATAALNLADAQRLHDSVKKGIAAIQFDFNHGAITAAGIQPMLVSIGVTPVRAAQYAAEWTVERHIPVQTANTQKVLGWLGEGAITPADAANRLTNLGWTRPDVKVMIKEAEYKEKELNAREMSAASHQKAEQAKQLEEAAEESYKQTRRLQDALRKATSPATLQSWFAKGIIGTNYFFRRTAAMGIPRDEAEALLNAAVIKTPTGSTPDHEPYFEQGKSQRVKLNVDDNVPPDIGIPGVGGES
jgi:hypothetical protein